ncbi:Lrp/AsnC family transcriptional regulator [Amphibacillus jilinensis]|uniref:Lrp/AsnC family transcriptional regulator n=1 Tax=Amphibacillus jilinensis TaxID=1216008 RepID=UPI0003684656|nr:Lrp/AsnC family transcriptional regulator [Amphibacillus jilinensis]
MDNVDRNILYHLQHNARLSRTELGKLVNLSQPAVTERVHRMEEQGVIKEYRTIISPEKIGKHAAAFMLFHTKNCLAFLDFCRSSPEVAECYRISGDHNYLLKVIADSTQDLEEFGNLCDSYGNYTILIVMSSAFDHKDLIPDHEEENLLSE